MASFHNVLIVNHIVDRKEINFLLSTMFMVTSEGGMGICICDLSMSMSLHVYVCVWSSCCIVIFMFPVVVHICKWGTCVNFVVCLYKELAYIHMYIYVHMYIHMYIHTHIYLLKHSLVYIIQHESCLVMLNYMQ